MVQLSQLLTHQLISTWVSFILSIETPFREGRSPSSGALFFPQHKFLEKFCYLQVSLFRRLIATLRGIRVSPESSYLLDSLKQTGESGFIKIFTKKTSLTTYDSAVSEFGWFWENVYFFFHFSFFLLSFFSLFCVCISATKTFNIFFLLEKQKQKSSQIIYLLEDESQ